MCTPIHERVDSISSTLRTKRTDRRSPRTIETEVRVSPLLERGIICVPITACGFQGGKTNSIGCDTDN
ncbi:hypothetical protein AArcCO_2753 [Halalkaliarchaeum sp. AArc-CO]|nr:hypothetical protein AArcCO_2753 [Halalkaliarchaeum sp. AArc-CO]